MGWRASSGASSSCGGVRARPRPPGKPWYAVRWCVNATEQELQRSHMNPTTRLGEATGHETKPRPSGARTTKSYVRSGVTIHFGRAERLYAEWPVPVCIVSDGPYEVDGFPGDTCTAESLTGWYEPHIKAWSERSRPDTTLWFWSTEVGWATVHPVLLKYGWGYRCCNIWDKGLGHIAGNSNSKTLKQFPVVTEVCAHYVKKPEFPVNGKKLSMQEWLHHEWKRTGLPFSLANQACMVCNAATRKYLTADHLWYYPPFQMFERLAIYANSHGDPSGILREIFNRI